MEEISIKKIHIIGSVGSGKSTLARNLSKTLQIPYYELDNIVWKRTGHGDIRNSEAERDELLKNIVQTDAWIIEGVHYKWMEPGFKEGDIILFLDTPTRKRNYRILKRYIAQRLGFEKGNYKQSLHMLKRMYYWNYGFEKKDKPNILAILDNYKDKLVFLKDNKDIVGIIRESECRRHVSYN